jgi:hypothetical protein
MGAEGDPTRLFRQERNELDQPLRGRVALSQRVSHLRHECDPYPIAGQLLDLLFRSDRRRLVRL